MTERSSSQGPPDDWGRGYLPGEQYAGEQYYGAPAPASGRPGAAPGPGPGSEPGSGLAGPGGMGAARPGSGMPGQGGPGIGGLGIGGQGMPTTPIWQAAPGQDGQAPGRPDQAGFGPSGFGQAGPGQGGLGQADVGAVPPLAGPHRDAADTRGFLAALFDFSFTSFVTIRIIKVLYVLILVMAAIAALVYTIIAFRVGATFGLLTLIIGDPLFIIIVMAFWRLLLESFVVVFRIAEDLRAVRERGERGDRSRAPAKSLPGDIRDEW